MCERGAGGAGKISPSHTTSRVTWAPVVSVSTLVSSSRVSVSHFLCRLSSWTSPGGPSPLPLAFLCAGARALLSVCTVRRGLWSGRPAAPPSRAAYTRRAHHRSRPPHVHARPPHMTGASLRTPQKPPHISIMSACTGRPATPDPPPPRPSEPRTQIEETHRYIDSRYL